MTDLDNVIAALNLEYGANRRYGHQIENSPFSQLNTILEGVRRTEGDHLEAMLAYVQQLQPVDPGVGRGFTSLLTHLRLNLAFEKAALAAYSTFAREAEDPELKKTFQHLARSEAGHINLFKELIARIEANQQPVIVYCPICGWELDYGIAPAEGATLRCPACKVPISLTLDNGDYAPKAQ